MGVEDAEFGEVDGDELGILEGVVVPIGFIVGLKLNEYVGWKVSFLVFVGWFVGRDEGILVGVDDGTDELKISADDSHCKNRKLSNEKYIIMSDAIWLRCCVNHKSTKYKVVIWNTCKRQWYLPAIGKDDKEQIRFEANNDVRMT